MTKKEELDAAILDINDQLDNQPDDDLYVDFCAMVSKVTVIENGFVEVLKAAARVRSLQTDYFKARKANLTVMANDLLVKSKAAEKEFDQLIASWNAQMGKTEQTQLGLFS